MRTSVKRPGKQSRIPLTPSRAIVITGTPGTGKTRLAHELSLLLHARHVEGTSFVKSEGLGTFDKARDTLLVDPTRLNKALKNLIKASKRQLVIDSHMAHFMPAKAVALCIVTTCELKTLEKRLTRRKYSKDKIRENLDAEIFEVCLIEAHEKGHKILVLDTTKTSPKTLAKVAENILKK